MIVTIRETYQRLVKTTPNPRATKKSNGELVGPLLPPPPPPCGVFVGIDADSDAEAIIVCKFPYAHNNVDEAASGETRRHCRRYLQCEIADRGVDENGRSRGRLELTPDAANGLCLTRNLRRSEWSTPKNSLRYDFAETLRKYTLRELRSARGRRYRVEQSADGDGND